MRAIKISAKKEAQTTENELLRVMVHGILHCMGYNDQTKEETTIMRKKEDEFISLFHVKQKRYV